MESSTTTSTAARGWMDYIRGAPAQAIDTHRQGKQAEPSAPAPVLDLTPAMGHIKELTPEEAEAIRLVRERQG